MSLDIILQRVLTIRIGKNAVKKLTDYFALLGDAIQEGLEPDDIESLVGILTTSDAGFKASRTKSLIGSPPPKRKVTITGYRLFMKDACQILKNENFTDNFITEVSARWKVLNDIEKSKWKEKASIANEQMRINTTDIKIESGDGGDDLSIEDQTGNNKKFTEGEGEIDAGICDMANVLTDMKVAD